MFSSFHQRPSPLTYPFASHPPASMRGERVRGASLVLSFFSVVYSVIVDRISSITLTLFSFTFFSWLRASLHHTHFPLLVLPQVACFFLNTSFHILFSIVFMHLLYHHCISLYPVYERSFCLSLPLTNFTQHDSLQVLPCSSELQNFFYG